MSTTLKQHRKRWTPKFSKNGQIIPSEGMKALTRREINRQDELFTFVSTRPARKPKVSAIKSVAKATLWTLVI